MAYQVELSRRAERDIEEAFDYIWQRAPVNAWRWRSRLEEKLQTLERMPRSFGLAPENRDSRKEVRQYLFGQYRVLYTIRERTVFILTIRRGARRYLSGRDIDAIF